MERDSWRYASPTAARKFWSITCTTENPNEVFNLNRSLFQVWSLTLSKAEDTLVTGGGDSVLNVWKVKVLDTINYIYI